MMRADQFMAKRSEDKSQAVAITEKDILFECPACGKSLVVDESAAGMTIACPKCRISVIVPPKTQSPPGPPPFEPTSLPKPTPPAPPQPAPPAAPAPKAAEVEVTDLERRLSGLSNQLRELQTQRTELTNRIASGINEVNRDLLTMSRLETSLQKVIGELTTLVNEAGATVRGGSKEAGQPTNPATPPSSGRSRVTFRS